MNDTMELFDAIQTVILKHKGDGCSADDALSAVEMVLDCERDITHEVAP